MYNANTLYSLNSGHKHSFAGVLDCFQEVCAKSSLSAINAENQQIIKQTPNFTPKNVKLGVFILFKTNHIRSENNLIKNRTNEKNNQFIFRKISYLCSK